MKIRKISWLLVPVIALGIVLTGCNKLETTSPTASQSEVVQKEVSYEGVDGKTAYQLLTELHQVQADSSSVGVMVKSIDGISQTDNEFWLYDVNGKEPSVGADKYETKSGDIVRWQLKSF